MNYKQTKIYKIWSILGDDIYIGATCKNRLCERMSSHREDYKKYKKTNTHLITSYILFDKYGIENCFIELLESKECNNKEELNQLEGHYIRTLECVNKIRYNRTEAELIKKGKEYDKKYYQLNKEKIKLRNKNKVLKNI